MLKYMYSCTVFLHTSREVVRVSIGEGDLMVTACNNCPMGGVNESRDFRNKDPSISRAEGNTEEHHEYSDVHLVNKPS